MHPRAEEFTRTARDEYGIDVDVREFPEGTKTAADAAEAVGCSVAQIASGIVLSAGDGLVVSVTSGANRVDMAKIAATVGVKQDDVSMADADAIKETLGWSIGGVPPFCHATEVPVFMDETLAEFETVWAAAGTPKAVFEIEPETLAELADAPLIDVNQ
ncbi:YbaK/EbsC family protein [Natronomonas salsuginis]|uniref:YbaK/EbsC family protein n=1 Tax=Natronomonas salsuginis TaxID=2217661 RepID=A0A4U5JIW2_9EURY|nr:YbaK/EbsC family protein [Natronomonas salsuginis]TKR27657.1 YbaK/EbsC family protein [Natronomonas salsuginis]